MNLKMKIKQFLCERFNIGVPQCVAQGSEFNIVLRDTKTSKGMQSGLECKYCNRYINFNKVDK